MEGKTFRGINKKNEIYTKQLMNTECKVLSICRCEHGNGFVLLSTFYHVQTRQSLTIMEI